MNIGRSFIVLCLLLSIFLVYRFVRPLQIFVVSPEFELPINIGELPEGLESISAESCGRCHVEIYREWSTSMHAKAWVDPYFQVDNEFDGNMQICLNCHTPLKDQQENLVLGFRDRSKFDPILKINADFDASLRDEGVTCAVCHIRNGTILGPYGSDAAPHPVKRDETISDGHTLCRRCHMVMGERWDTFYRFPPCGTYDETKEAGREPECMKCHMPAIKRSIVTGGETRKVRKHLWLGGHNPGMVKKGLTINLDFKEHSDGKVEYILSLFNSGSNHRIPTGTPDRHLTVTFRLLNENMKTIKEKSYKLKRTIMWRPFIVDLWDTRLKAGEKRLFSFTVKRQAKPVFIGVEVRYHLLDERRRRRIGYENKEPIDYSIFYKRIEVNKNVKN